MAVLSDYFGAVVKHFNPDGDDLFRDENNVICRSQGITYKKHRTEMSDSTLHCHHQNPK